MTSAFLTCPKGCDDRRPITWDLATSKWVCDCCGYTGSAKDFGVEPARKVVDVAKRGLLTVLLWAVVAHAHAQTNPLTLPLADVSKVTTGPTIDLPATDGAGGDLMWGSGALGVSEDGTRLYVSCNVTHPRAGVAVLALPQGGGTATVVQPCKGLTHDRIKQIIPGWGAGMPTTGGVLAQGGRVCVTAFGSYDANGIATGSHWCGPDLDHLAGPYRGTVRPGMVHAQMGVVPPEWRALLGGPAFSTAGYTSITSRSSQGPAVTIFDPATVTADGFDMQMLLGCPYSEPSCARKWTSWGRSSDDFEGSELAGGTFIVPGTRALAVIEREGEGSVPGPGIAPAPGATATDRHDCYGYATTDPALHGADHPGPDQARWCYSLADPLNQKGNKAYPYKLVAKLYDLADLVAVKQGALQPWQVRPYAVTMLPGPTCISGGVFNPARGEYYWLGCGGLSLRVLTGWAPGTAPPPPPSPPTATLVANPASIAPGQTAGLCWTTAHADSATITPGVVVVTPTAGGCVDVTPSQTTAYALTAPGAGGSVTAMATVAVVTPPPPPPAGFSGILRAQTPYTVSGLVVGLRLVLQVPDVGAPSVPAVGVSVSLGLPLVDGTIERRPCSIWKIEPTGYVTAGARTRVTVQCPGISGVRLQIDTAAPDK